MTTTSSIEEQLEDLCGDLVAYRDNEPFIRRLFSSKPGDWHTLVDLCAGLIGGTLETLSSFPGEPAAQPRVTWIDLPDSLHGPGYAVILFFLEDPQWSMAALYHYGLLKQE
jgi:hypothetical protein